VSEALHIDGRSIKILIVDDEDIVLSIARDTLEDAGCEVRVAENGEKALEYIQSEFYDFILTDIRMPGINGLDLAKEAREIIPSVGIIFMTGYANLDTAKDAIKEGAYDYILKPFEIDELRQAVKNAVTKKTKDTEKTISNELSRLSDLNQLMYTVNDRQSLMRLSLGFALMQGQTEKGSIVFRNTENNRVDIISTVEAEVNNYETGSVKCDCLRMDKTPDGLGAPIVITSIKEHPLYKADPNDELAAILSPTWHDDRTRMVQIPLKRGDKIYGLLILGYPCDGDEIKESSLKFLTITAGQIAISLENIILLEESRNAYARLQDLQDQALQLERMAVKGQMSAEIGHELNNFLGVMMGNLTLMEHNLEQNNYENLNKYIQKVIQNLDSIKKFTHGLMDFTKLQSKFEECSVGRLVEDIIDQLQTQNRFASVKIEYQRPESEISTLADSGQIKQLIYNLINNAGDALQAVNDDRDRLIMVNLTADVIRREFILKVTDNGIGFNPETLSLAFQKRFTTKKSGHGFGLLVCRRIIDNHQGILTLDSHSQTGTTIEIKFPIRTISPEPVETSRFISNRN
jgi:signal transduction histidine kinase/CheY-like chemotaxis protein